MRKKVEKLRALDDIVVPEIDQRRSRGSRLLLSENDRGRSARSRLAAALVAFAVFGAAAAFAWTALRPQSVGSLGVTRVAASASTTNITAASIVRDGGPTGDELANALGLTLQEKFADCSYYQVITDDGAGYCLQDLDMDMVDRYVIAMALRGRVLTPDEVEQVRETLSMADAHSSPTG
jgi:hypothetical protein